MHSSVSQPVGANDHVTLSVVIPALNEAEYLPSLLERLQGQTREPDEVIVADALSSDGTADIARAYGCRVTEGGTPGKGRNAGASIARGNVLLFLDADVLPGPSFVKDALASFVASGFGVGAGLMEAYDGPPAWRRTMRFASWAVTATASWFPHAFGACLFATSECHRRLGGFDERPLGSEDHDYARRAKSLGEFGVLRDVRVPVSMRRFEFAGHGHMAVYYAWSEANLLLGRRIPLQKPVGDSGAAARVQRGVTEKLESSSTRTY
jgi:glycosyltransferase involved in cell wall biosynthesis